MLEKRGRKPKVNEKVNEIMGLFTSKILNNSKMKKFSVMVSVIDGNFESKLDFINGSNVKRAIICTNGHIENSVDDDYICTSCALEIIQKLMRKNPVHNAKYAIRKLWENMSKDVKCVKREK